MVTLTGYFTLLDGTPAVGSVLIRPSRSPILDLDGKQVIAGPQRFTLDAEGRFSVDLPPTDDPALGEPFTYNVMVAMHHAHWQVLGLTLPADMVSVDVLDPPAGVVREYPTRAEWDALTGATVAEMETALAGTETARDAAVGAASDAETARDEAVEAKDDAESARDGAVDAAAAAGTARDEAVATRDGMVTGARVEGDDLILTTVDESEINAGNVRGPAGGVDSVDGMSGEVSLESRYAWRSNLLGRRTTIIGSSSARGSDATKGIDSSSLTSVGGSWFSWATYYSNQRILRGENVGVIGDTLDGILARIGADVVAAQPRPDNCMIYCGYNDATAGVSPAQYLSKMKEIVAILRAAGITPILCTNTPTINNSMYAVLNTYNLLLRRLAASEGLPLLDLHALTVDPATGAQKPEFYGDGVHPSIAGHQLIGRYVADTLAPLMPTAAVDLTVDPTDPDNLISNGLFGGTVTDGRAESWGLTALPSGGSVSVVDAPEVALGRVQRLAAVDTASQVALYQYVEPPKFAAGDRLSISARFRTVGPAKSVLWVDFNGSTAEPYMNPLSIGSTGEGTTYCEYVVPPGTSRIVMRLRLFEGTGSLEIGQLTMRNLSRLGG